MNRKAKTPRKSQLQLESILIICSTGETSSRSAGTSCVHGCLPTWLPPSRDVTSRGVKVGFPRAATLHLIPLRKVLKYFLSAGCAPKQAPDRWLLAFLVSSSRAEPLRLRGFRNLWGNENVQLDSFGRVDHVATRHS